MPPNVLFVLTDQMRASAMKCAGNPDVRTPTLDRLADEGTRVTAAQTTKPMCSLCGIETPAKVQGRDVAAHLRGETTGPDAAYGQDWRVGNAVPDQEDWGPWGQPYRVLRTGRYSLTVDYTLQTQYLFDLERDPYEQTNLAADPEHAALEADLRDRLFAWAHDIDDREFVTRQRYM